MGLGHSNSCSSDSRQFATSEGDGSSKTQSQGESQANDCTQENAGEFQFSSVNSCTNDMGKSVVSSGDNTANIQT
jgi:hypothetical protein